MPNEEFIRVATLLFVLLNPFLMSVYLLDLIQDMDSKTFSRVLLRGATISTAVFVFFAVLGDAIFTDVLQVRFAAFLMFGGVVFLIVSVRSFFVGVKSLRELRGNPEHAAGSIAMPFMIGPGTVSASVSAGSNLSPSVGAIAIVTPVAMSVTILIGLKFLYDLVQSRHETLVTRYVEITGRIMSLVTGTIAIEMILQGLEAWLPKVT